jgi:HSP20 family protein
MVLVHRGRRTSDEPVASSSMTSWGDWWPRLFDPESDRGWLRMEEYQDGDTLVLRAELPDVDVDKDVDVTVEDGTLRIHARRESKSEQKDRSGYRTEFRYGEFDRRIALPGEATADDVKATYSDGILEVRVPCPKPKATEPTKVSITK